MATGPLAGVRILEFSGIGPGPFCGMLLSDMGADVLRIDRKDGDRGEKTHVTRRGRKSVALDLKKPEARETCLRLMDTADAIYEGFRPGVMERLGLGPETALARNPKLVYGRMTGWGQQGPLSQAAGHDINYIAITGALHAIGTVERPVPPLNLVGDFGGGALYLAVGLLAALLHARATGEGQVVDAAMSDGAASLMAAFMATWREAAGPIPARRMVSMAVRLTMASISARTGVGWHSVRLSHSSSRSCCENWRLRTFRGNGNAIPRTGRACERGWRQSSRRKPRRNGSVRWKAAMPVSRVC